MRSGLITAVRVVGLRLLRVVSVAHAIGVLIGQVGTTFGQVIEDVGSSQVLVNSETDVIFLEPLGETDVRGIHKEAGLLVLVIVESLVNVQ